MYLAYGIAFCAAGCAAIVLIPAMLETALERAKKKTNSQKNKAYATKKNSEEFRMIIANKNGLLIAAQLIEETDKEWTLKPFDNPNAITVSKKDEQQEVFSDLNDAMAFINEGRETPIFLDNRPDIEILNKFTDTRRVNQ